MELASSHSTKISSDSNCQYHYSNPAQDWTASAIGGEQSHFVCALIGLDGDTVGSEWFIIGRSASQTMLHLWLLTHWQHQAGTNTTWANAGMDGGFKQ